MNSVTLTVANAMSWEDLKVLLLEEYCPRGEVQKLEQELWNLKMTGSDLVAYTARFNDLAALCPTMVNQNQRKLKGTFGGCHPRFKGMS